MTTPPETIAPQQLAAMREAKLKAQLAQRELDVVRLQIFVVNGLGQADSFDDVSGLITRAPVPQGKVRPELATTPEGTQRVKGVLERFATEQQAAKEARQPTEEAVVGSNTSTESTSGSQGNPPSTTGTGRNGFSGPHSGPFPESTR